MTPEVKAQWLADLRSGEFEQGRGVMRSPEGQFCCMGVLCDQYARTHGEDWGPVTTIYGAEGYRFDGEVTFPPEKVVDWAGLEYFDPNVLHPDGIQGTVCISTLNDHDDLTFAQIADLIEAQL